MKQEIIFAVLIALTYAAPQSGSDLQRKNPGKFCEGYYAGLKHAQKTDTEGDSETSAFCRGFYAASGLTQPRLDEEDEKTTTSTTTTTRPATTVGGGLGSSGLGSGGLGSGPGSYGWDSRIPWPGPNPNKNVMCTDNRNNPWVPYCGAAAYAA